jgi:ubiquinone/menaquinone biosynthesis C-methylase UbiE/uncharacterized protein YbaR (Trm112 family)
VKKKSLDVYRCPVAHTPLSLSATAADGESVVEGELSAGERQYSVRDGMPIFAPNDHLAGTALFARKYYASIAGTYDDNVHVTFELYNERELDVRLSMIRLLDLRSDSKVLELSAGTGKDSELIAKQLSAAGQLWLMDISPDMLRQAQQKTANLPVPVEAAVGDACRLPYRDDYFDALYCFAGVGHFTDQKAALSEMARVVRPGGRVVFCEKNVPPWLRDTEYGKILINNNPMFDEPPPIHLIPVQARNVGIRWILGNVHYVVDYTVGDGEPVGNFDLVLPGHRGGTFKTRYFGKLEGVSPEAKQLAEKAADSAGVSRHKWLDDLIKARATHDLKGK